MAWIEHDYPDTAALTAAVAARLRDACGDALRARGHALLALAGGKTPFPIYRALAEAPLDWSNVVVMPGDDRCVALNHPASNVGALREAFAVAQGIVVEPLTAAYGDPSISLRIARTALAAHRDDFDVVVLGMGEDAHTASLFPDAVGLHAAMAPDASHDAFLIIPEPMPPEAPFPRVTLGLARLLRAREIHLIVTGARKREVLRAAQAACDPLHMPVSALLHAPDAVVRIHWSP